jgi:hypothetical protein
MHPVIRISPTLLYVFGTGHRRNMQAITCLQQGVNKVWECITGVNNKNKKNSGG